MQALLIQLAAAAASAKVDTNSAGALLQTHRENFKDNIHFILGMPENLLSEDEAAQEKKAEATREFLRNNMETEKKFESLDSIMKAFMNAKPPLD